MAPSSTRAATIFARKPIPPKTEFLGSVRGRVGWADDNVLFYATGGAAYVHADVRTSLGGQDPTSRQ
jgi:opacity protein-like surface antigen